ncbi:merozoite surface antigen 2, allelic form 2-like [Penaeus chinensis]|uniref:merozoite surface antigen 2, allelic form 2-like n=1 Tax=Penaeus chinensis TaxID=139456 RepID=UPI001FB5B683|nr:merozoite surface antigen 2, allelic form 2-like [Penaeus chinensis]
MYSYEFEQDSLFRNGINRYKREETCSMVMPPLVFQNCDRRMEQGPTSTTLRTQYNQNSGCPGVEVDQSKQNLSVQGERGSVGDAEAGGEAGDAEAGGEAGDAEAGGEAGDAEAGGEAGDAEAGGEAGDAEAGGEAGDAEAGGEAVVGVTTRHIITMAYHVTATRLSHYTMANHNALSSGYIL